MIARQRFRQIGWVMALFTLGFALYAFAAQERASTLADADRLYEEKSYAAALKSYEHELQAGAVPAGRRDEVQYRIAVSLGKAKQWDRALEQSLEFVKTHRGTVWEPRGLYWL